MTNLPRSLVDEFEERDWQSTADRILEPLKQTVEPVRQQLSTLAQNITHPSFQGFQAPSHDDLLSMVGLPTSGQQAQQAQQQGFVDQVAQHFQGFSAPSHDDLLSMVGLKPQQSQQPSPTTATPSAPSPGVEQRPVAASGVPSAMPSAMPTAMPTGQPPTGSQQGSSAAPSSSAPVGPGAAVIANAGTRASRFASQVDRVSKEEGVPADVLAAIIDTEDSGENSVSVDGARGLTQVVPGQGFDLPGEDASDPLTSIRQSARALKEKYRMAGGDWQRAGGLYFGQGSDSLGNTSDVYQQRFDANRAKYGAPPTAASPTAAGSPSPVAAASPPASVAAGAQRPTQFAEGLSYSQAIAACGLAGVAWFIAKTGRTPQTVAEVRDAAQVSQDWDPGSGMHGAQATAHLMRQYGIATHVEDGVDWTKVRRDVSNGNPVMFDTDAGSNGHYYTVQEARQRSDGQWEYDLGTSATDLRASGGRRWFTADEVEGLGFGRPFRTIYSDNPQTPAPSMVAGKSEGAPSIPQSATSGDVQKALGVDIPETGLSAGDQKRAKLAALSTASGQEPNRPVPGGPITEGPPPDNAGGYNDPHLGFPLDRNRPWTPDAEGIDRTNDQLQPRDPQGDPLPLGPVPPNNGQVVYDEQGNPHWVGGTNYQEYIRDRSAGQMYRQPLQATGGPDSSTFQYPTADRGEASGALAAAPVYQEPSSTYNDPTDMGTLSQPLPSQAPSPADDPGGAQFAAQDAYSTPQSGSVSSTSNEGRHQEPFTPPPGLQAVYDGAGNFLHWIQGAATDVGNTVATEGIATPIGRGIANAVTRPLLGKPPLEDSGQPETSIDRAIVETGRSLGSNIGAAQQGYQSGDPLQTGMGVLGVVGDLAPSTTLARQLNEMLPKADTPLGEIGAGDVVMTAALVHDAARLGYGVIKAGGRIGSKIAQAITEGVPAERFSEWMASNAERVAAADARMAEQGSTVAGGTLGVTPDAAPRPADTAPPFYSQLQRTIEEKMPNRAMPQQVQGILKGSQVKPDEIAWTGFDDWLREQAGPVTKQAALDFLDQNAVKVEEVVKGKTRPRADGTGVEFDPASGPTRYEGFKIPGGENYRELLLTLPSRADGPSARMDAIEQELARATDPAQRRALQIEYRDLSAALREPDIYQSSHWNEPNVLAHVRFNDRIAPDGKKVLLVDEIQSDWHQAGRKQGYQGLTPDGKKPPTPQEWDALTQRVQDARAQFGEDSSQVAALMRQAEEWSVIENAATGGTTPRVPDAPFKKTWPELAIKRMIRYASENGYDAIAWPPGSVHAERYSGDGVDRAAGMAGFYDQILPTTAQKIGKKFGARVGQTDLQIMDPSNARVFHVLDQNGDQMMSFGNRQAAEEMMQRAADRPEWAMPLDRVPSKIEEGKLQTAQTVHSMDITPAMRESVMQQGQPLFATPGAVPPTRGAGALSAATTEAGRVIAGGVGGGTIGAGLPADTPEERRRNALIGAGVGMVAGPLASRAIRSEGGALATFGASPHYRPPTAAELKAAEAQGARRGEMLNRPVTAPDTAVPRLVRAATAATDNRAGMRWAEDILSDAAGSPRMRENDPARPSTQSRVNSGSVANERIETGLAPAVQDAGAAGLQNDLPRFLEDMHHRDVLNGFYDRGYQAVMDDRAQKIAAAQARGVAAPVIARMQALAQTDAEKAGELAMRKRQGSNPEHAYEATEARLQEQEQRLTADGRWTQLQDAAQAVWDHNAETRQRLVDSGNLDPQVAADLAAKYPHYVPTVPISHLTEGGGGVASSSTAVSRGTKPSVSALEDVGTSGERLNPIVASRNATIRAERDIQRNAVAHAFAQMMDDAMQASPSAMATNTATHRTFMGGGVDVHYFEDGKPVTLSVPKTVADGLEAASSMGMSSNGVTSFLKRVTGTVTSTLTAARASFVPVNVARDASDYATRTMVREGNNPARLPAILGTWADEAGKAARDTLASNATGRTAIGAATGFGAGALQGDDQTPLSTRLVHGAEGAAAGALLLGANKVQTTGKAAEYLARGGGSGAAVGSLKAGQRWYREQLPAGGASLRSPREALGALGDWAHDVISLQGVKGINERAETISRTAAMRRAEAQGAGPVEAMLAGRDSSYDPDRAGTVTRAWNGFIPFLNATVQGGAQFARMMKQHPVATTAAIGATLGPVMLATEYWNRSDPQRAQAYDDVPQYVKDSGIVLMMPGAGGSDTRGQKPNYLWLPTEVLTPFVVGMRAAMQHADAVVPGMSPSAGRSDANPNSVAPQALSALNEALSVFYPVRGDSAASIGSTFVPPIAKQFIELGQNKDLFRGGTISSPSQDERASAFAHTVAGAANSAGRALGNDLLQNVTPSHVDYLARQVPAYGDIITGASDMVKPSPYKQAEQGRLANEPFVGGIASRFDRDAGGANLERAQGQAAGSPDLQAALQDARMRPSEVDVTVPSSVGDLPLNRDEQLEAQNQMNEYLPEELAKAQSSPKWDDPLQAQALVKAAVTRARNRATLEVIRTIPKDEQNDRKRQQADAKVLVGR